uniref:tRNA pseudouridine synthase n=2 Tax=Spongospora subterranea TaxID=70186 RepID=A0A0H5QIR6_9EUKA|eukprot:CRZ01980.1 hypothetical protein [Spongospora subterranea]
MEKPKVVGCGRTDTGVHAIGMPVHVDLERRCRKTGALKEPFSPDLVMKSLNYHLREEADIVVTSVIRVPMEFHARRSAVSRSYMYRIAHGCNQIPVFEMNRVYRVWQRLNINAMAEAAKNLTGRFDFTTFRAVCCEAASPIRTIESFDVIPRDSSYMFGPAGPPSCGNLIDIFVSADGFLYHQVRNLVAFLIGVGKGDFSPSDTTRLLDGRKRDLIPPMVPAYGLYFLKAEYPIEHETI